MPSVCVDRSFAQVTQGAHAPPTRSARLVASRGAVSVLSVTLDYQPVTSGRSAHAASMV